MNLALTFLFEPILQTKCWRNELNERQKQGKAIAYKWWKPIL